IFLLHFSGSWCATVPKSWINSDDKIITWPHKKIINATLACKKQFVPRDDWETFKYDKLLGPYDKELDDSDKVKLPSFEYNGGNDIDPTEQLGDGDFAETQELDYGNYFDDPPHPSFKQSVVISKPVVSKIETVVIPGIGRESTTSVDKNFQKLKSLSEYNLGQSKHLNNPESKSTTNHGVGKEDNVINQNLHDDSKNAAGSSTTKKSVLTPREPSLPPTIDSMDRVNSTTGPSSESHNCCLETGFWKKALNWPMMLNISLFLTAACRSVLNSVSRKLDALLNMHADNPRPTTTQQANVLPNFPISSYEDLAKFNQLLVDKEIARTQYEDLIKQRRNTDGKKCIRSVLGFILTDELCCKLSWSGQKKTIKVEKMSFVEHLRDTVVSNSRSSLDDCKQAIMSWLQHANDRVKLVTGKHNPQ
ncbi:hypothetical protein NQ314_000045, partial [Rhamnusium bicolor]